MLPLLIESIVLATSLFSRPWSLLTLDGKLNLSTASLKRFATVSALLLVDAFKQLITHEYPSIPSCITILYSCINLWFLSICLYAEIPNKTNKYVITIQASTSQ